MLVYFQRYEIRALELATTYLFTLNHFQMLFRYKFRSENVLFAGRALSSRIFFKNSLLINLLSDYYQVTHQLARPFPHHPEIIADIFRIFRIKISVLVRLAM